MSFASKTALPLHTSWTVGGALRETLFWPNSQGLRPPRAVLLVIPGNPGLVDFYIDFCTILHKKFSDLDIIGVSHLGHTLFPNTRGILHRDRYVYTLDEQVANMLLVFDEVRKEYSDSRLYLCGHSVGCYFCEKLIESRESEVDRVFGLFPAIESMAETPRGKQLRPLFWPMMRGAVANTVELLRSILPISAIHRLAELSGSLNAENSHLVVDKMLHRQCILNVLGMAADEMVAIRGLNESLYRRAGSKFVFYYGEDDQWVPVEHYRRMREVNHGGQVVLCVEGISHAFVTRHSTQMAVIVACMLKKEMGQEQEQEPAHE
ncbi:hypothetical protein GGI07_002226 [Coemansia sp. Benny D115]|nr:hypothetical protein GGI07_002226 [Coemansia sp. Benny D115]